MLRISITVALDCGSWSKRCQYRRLDAPAPDIGRAAASTLRGNIPPMWRAIIFDFDGVIADTEPLHFEAFAKALAEHSLALSSEEYFSKYVGLNDDAFIRTLFSDRGLALDDARRRQIQATKNAAYQKRIDTGLSLLPGVAALVRDTARLCPLAICSGARRVEIDTILRRTGLLSFFSVIVSADEVIASKPDPAGYLHTLNQLRLQNPNLNADECLAIEDSLLGIRAASAAGIRVLAVFGASHHPTPAIRQQCAEESDWITQNLAGFSVEELAMTC